MATLGFGLGYHTRFNLRGLLGLGLGLGYANPRVSPNLVKSWNRPESQSAGGVAGVGIGKNTLTPTPRRTCTFFYAFLKLKSFPDNFTQEKEKFFGIISLMFKI